MESIKLGIVRAPIIIQLMTGGAVGAGLGHGPPAPRCSLPRSGDQALY